MKIYIAFDQHRVIGVYTTFKEAEKQGKVEEFDLDIKLCSCGAPLTLRTVVLAGNGKPWEMDEWECVPCAQQTNWGDVKPIPMRNFFERYSMGR